MNSQDAHKHSSNHRKIVLDSEKCGCFYCLSIFTPDAIKEWSDEGQTALCPHCGIDSIIGSGSGFIISVTFLREMHERWFGEACGS
jgi:hypothetical protein